MANRQRVEAPQATPPRYSLLIAAPALTDDAEWEDGWTFQPEGCGDGGRDVAVLCGIGDARVPSDNRDNVVGDPFYVWASDKCSTLGGVTRDYQARARRQLLAIESREVADELWTGTLNADGLDNPFLTDPTSDTITAAPASPVDAFAALTGALMACSPQRGMIHVTPQYLGQLVAASAVFRDGNLWLDAMGNIVVADAGYDGSGPGGTPAGATQWAYATSMISIRTDSIEIVPNDFTAAVDTALNSIRYYAQRLIGYTSDWCCHLAAEVSLPVPAIGPPS